MKNWIKIRLKESLEEVSTTNKPKFGSGADHNVYKSIKNPDRLYKIGNEIKVDEWVEIFKAFPKYFPRIYRVFPHKRKPTLTVVEIEKLNTAKAARELKEIDEFLLNISSEISCDNEFITSYNFFEGRCFKSVIDAANNSDNPYILPMLYKWGKFLKEVSSIVERDLGRPLDIHVGNVAYDKMGKLKMIDI